MKIYKFFLFSFILFAITPSLALASWWNPLSWNWPALFNDSQQTKAQIEQISNNNSTTTISITSPTSVTTSTPAAVSVIPKKNINKVSTSTQKPNILPTTTTSITSIQIMATTTSIAASTGTTTQTSPFVITFPVTYAANSVWKEGVDRTIRWTPYIDPGYLDYYQIVMSNTVADLSRQVYGAVIYVPSPSQTWMTFTVPRLLEEFSAKSGIPENVLNDNFYIKVNATRGYGKDATVVASTPILPFTIATIVNINANPVTVPYTGATPVSSVSYGKSATINWTSPNATACSISPGNWTGTISGSMSTGRLTKATTYIITCTGTGGVTSSSYTVGIAP
jgi:hypothetical protein